MLGMILNCSIKILLNAYYALRLLEDVPQKIYMKKIYIYEKEHNFKDFMSLCVKYWLELAKFIFISEKATHAKLEFSGQWTAW